MAARRSEVPPTAVTYCEKAGYSSWNPWSPLLTVNATPGCWKCLSSCWAASGSAGPPQLFETKCTPCATAWSIAANRFVSELSSASTTSRRHSGQAALTMSTSRSSSAPQCSSAIG